MKALTTYEIKPTHNQFLIEALSVIKEEDRAFYDMSTDFIPSGRHGTPDEIGKVATSIVSPSTSWVIGPCLAENSGQRRANSVKTIKITEYEEYSHHRM
ncbi:hypothetical protein LB456_13190 [Psychroflexus sp. CAK57W]|uniref:hypothetical protein n=1 Tax=Psychroflexus curvus TaxID=2873595 RepID=UPI001CD00B69|nr:hypothetical protein [Psychroflexus curvus]MBZ9788416.1 hypothetical protein [Psychroflexus curvus]